MGGSDEILSPTMTVVGMVNGMIGGLILILPVLALDAGYVLTFIVILLTGIFSLYSCYLCVIHMGDQPDLDYAILRHFNGKRGIKIFYDLCVWSNLILIDMLYFQLIEIQWDGLIGPNQAVPVLNPIINAIVLFVLVFVLKYMQFGASIMAYGIISIATYLVFLIWVISTSDQGNQQVEYKAFGSGAVGMAAAMGQAFSIQSFFMPVLKKNPNPSRYVFYTILAYIAGGLAYFYIAYMGSFGIWHRYLAGTADSSQITIEDYFGAGAWEVKIIESIYLIHLYSVFPEFMLISKKRLFGVIGIEQSHRGNVSAPQIIYFAVAVGVCFIMGVLKVSISDIIDINGAVIGFFFIYFLPALLHIKCMYFSKGKRPIPKIQLKIDETPSLEVPPPMVSPRKESEIEIQSPVVVMKIEEGKEKLKEPLLEVVKKKTEGEDIQVRQSEQSVPKMVLSNQQLQNSYYYCDCGKDENWKKTQALDILLIIIMVLMGAFIMVNGIYTVAT